MGCFSSKYRIEMEERINSPAKGRRKASVDYQRVGTFKGVEFACKTVGGVQNTYVGENGELKNYQNRILVQKVPESDQINLYLIDDHGPYGGTIGDEISRILPERLRDIASDPFKFESNALNAYKELDDEINNMKGRLMNRSQRSGCSVTSISLIRSANQLYASNVGDAKGFFFDVAHDGEYFVQSITEDHSVQNQFELKRVQHAGARVETYDAVMGKERPGWCEYTKPHDELLLWLPMESRPGIRVTRSIGDEEAQYAAVSSNCFSKVIHVGRRSKATSGGFVVMANHLFWTVLRNSVKEEFAYDGNRARNVRVQCDPDTSIGDMPMLKYLASQHAEISSTHIPLSKGRNLPTVVTEKLMKTVVQFLDENMLICHDRFALAFLNCPLSSPGSAIVHPGLRGDLFVKPHSHNSTTESNSDDDYPEPEPRSPNSALV
eukprot:TRINITY_DN1287_c0_g1_i2.p1 TRINITY_DN1287_c0_g1~~TRINITY_DN1287_c0_g1_i2.p1  ORF type:complete len:436 (+),score=92.92 TRINITY_DN1287_c0_g1_i2:239-1546(+)